MNFDFLDLGLLPQTALVFMLGFVRLGSMLMLMPALGERSVPVRLRLALALLLTLMLYPIVAPRYGAVPESLAALGLLVAGEFVIGFAIGFAARLALAALNVAGSAIAMQLSLAFAESVDPSQGQHGALVANFLTVTAITLIFATDLHHLAIAGLVGSYDLFAPGTLPPAGDFAAMAAMTVAEAFRVGAQIAAPFIVFGLIFQFGLGILSRLMPQIQIFFIAMPAGIFFGLALLMVLIGTMMTWYLGHVEAVLSRFIGN